MELAVIGGEEDFLHAVAVQIDHDRIGWAASITL